MIILDANLPPGLALWITAKFQIPGFSAGYLHLSNAEDKDIVMFARSKTAIVIAKDDDFVSLLNASWKSSQNCMAYLWKYFKISLAGNI